MKCATHPSIDAVAFCGMCGRALCPECKRDVSGMVYCETCLAARLQSPYIPPLITPGTGPSPGVALALGLIPGVGAIYNGQIVKAIIQVLIFASLISLGDKVGGPMESLFVMGAIAFYFYMVIDSYQTAKRRQLGQPVEEWLGLGDMKLNAPIGAALLIGLGALFLMDNLGVPVFRHMGKFWPVLLIVIGVLLLQRRMGGAQPPSEPKPPTPPTPPQGPSNMPGPTGM
jgi:TM2 domain-containing membrane protein YozV